MEKEYVINHLSFISPNQTDIWKALELVKGQSRFDFNKIIPTPQSIEETTILGKDLYSSNEFINTAIGEYITTKKTNLLRTKRYTQGKTIKEIIYNKIPALSKNISNPKIMNSLIQSYERFSDAKRITKAQQVAENYYHNLKNYNHPNWKGWREENWGTKWNAFRISTTPYEPPSKKKNLYIKQISFYTANQPPIPVLKKLSQICQEKGWNITLKLNYAHQEIGKSAGKIIIQNEKIIKQQTYENNTYEATKESLHIWQKDNLIAYIKENKETGTYNIDYRQKAL